jgi:hypothetical protein
VLSLNKIIISRIINYLKTGPIQPPTLFSKKVLKDSYFPQKITKEDKLYFGVYNKKNVQVLNLLGSLTDNKFKDGAIARILLRAPTIEEFSKLWRKSFI